LACDPSPHAKDSFGNKRCVIPGRAAMAAPSPTTHRRR
jgi:hypothetical protein